MNFRDIEKKIRTPAVWALGAGIVLSLAVLSIYIAESGLQDVSDETLFRLLALLRYLSFLVCICSVYLLAAGIFRVIKRPGVFLIVQIVLFLCSTLYGAGIILIDAFILSITGGNG